MGQIGKIQRVPLREVWEHEALEFTPWLKNNIDVLNEVLEHEELNLYLSDIEVEQDAGDFSVDMVAKDETDGIVIIENQLEKSDHDHLGKVITYLTAKNAKNAIWIAADPRQEHIAAINWLNASTDSFFYLLKLEAVKIGDSDSAPLLTLIAGKPHDQKGSEPLSPRDKLLYEFWEGLLELAKGRTTLHANIAPLYQMWIGTGAGKSGLSFNYVIYMHAAKVDFYIDVGSKETNKKIFDTIHEAEASIEAEFGDKLDWQRLDDKRACRIMKTLEIGGYRDDKSKWPEIQNAMIDTMIRFEKALRPHIEALQI
jgi:hypothetical protein